MGEGGEHSENLTFFPALRDKLLTFGFKIMFLGGGGVPVGEGVGG